MATIRKRGERWHVQIRRLGLPTQTASFDLKDEAVKWARRQEVLLDRGVDFTRGSEPIELKVLLARYEAEVTASKRSRASEIVHLRQLGRSFLAAIRIDHIRAADIARWRDQRLTEVASATVRKELTLLGHVIAIAIREWGFALPDNPVKAVKKPPAGRARTRRLLVDEWAKIDCALKQCRNPFLRAAVHLALLTGMRRGEILSLTWEHVDWTVGTLYLPITKNGDPRFVPLSPDAKSILERLWQRAEGQRKNLAHRLFPISPNALRMAWERVRKRAGAGDLRFHDLRHEAISRFFEMGLSIPEVALISGHKDPRMLFRYTHLRASDLAKKLNQLASSSHAYSPTGQDESHD